MKFYLAHPIHDPSLAQWFREDGDKMRNINNGFIYTSMVTILKEVEAKSWKDLDWYITMSKPDSSAGWLSPKGEFHGCRSKDHVIYADRVLKKDSYDLEDEGWIHVYGAPGTQSPWISTKWPTKEQLRWLHEKGYDVSPYSKEFKKSTELIKKEELKDDRIN